MADDSDTKNDEEKNVNDTIDGAIDDILDEAREEAKKRKRARRKRVIAGICVCTTLTAAAVIACKHADRTGKKCPVCTKLADKLHCSCGKHVKATREKATQVAASAASTVSNAAKQAASTAADAAQIARTAAQTAVNAAHTAADSAATAAAKASEVKNAAGNVLSKVRDAAPIKPPARISGVYEVTRIAGDSIVPDRSRYAVDMRVRRIPVPPTPIAVAKAAKSGVDDARAFFDAHLPGTAE